MPRWRLKGLARWILKAFPDHPVTEDVTADDILGDLRRMKVTHFFNFIYPIKVEETDKLNEFNARFCQNTPGAIPFASMHQDTPGKAALAESLLMREDYVGFKFHPFVQRFDPWDSRMDRLYSFLQEASKPVFFHTGFEAFYNLKMPVDQLERLIKRYPRLPMVFVHMAFPEMSTCFKLLDDYPELYLDATNVLSFLRPEFEPMVKSMPDGYRVIEELLEGLGMYSERIMYGSDHPVGMGSLDAVYRDLEELPVSDKVKLDLSKNTAMALVNRFLPQFDWGTPLVRSC